MKTIKNTLEILLIAFISMNINAQEVVEKASKSRTVECEFYEQIYNNVATKFEKLKDERTNDDEIFPTWSSNVNYTGFLSHEVMPKYGVYTVTIYSGSDDDKAQEQIMTSFNSWTTCVKSGTRTFFKVSDKDTTEDVLGERVAIFSSDQDNIMIKFKYKKNKIIKNNKLVDNFEVYISFSHYGEK